MADVFPEEIFTDVPVSDPDPEIFYEVVPETVLFPQDPVQDASAFSSGDGDAASFDPVPEAELLVVPSPTPIPDQEQNLTPTPEADLTPTPTPFPMEEITQRLDQLIELQTAENDNLVRAHSNTSLYLSFIGGILFFIAGGLFVYALLSKVRI